MERKTEKLNRYVESCTFLEKTVFQFSNSFVVPEISGLVQELFRKEKIS